MSIAEKHDIWIARQYGVRADGPAQTVVKDLTGPILSAFVPPWSERRLGPILPTTFGLSNIYMNL